MKNIILNIFSKITLFFNTLISIRDLLIKLKLNNIHKIFIFLMTYKFKKWQKIENKFIIEKKN